MNVFLKVFYFLALFPLIALYFIAPRGMSPVLITILLFGAFIAVLSFFLLKKEPYPNLRRQYLKHSILALLGILIVFFQRPIDFLLKSFGPSPNMSYWADRDIVVKALSLALIGLLCFLLGLLSYRKKKKTSNHSENKLEKKVGTRFFLILMLGSLTFYFATVNPIYFAGGYGDVIILRNTRIALSLFWILAFATLIQKCRNMRLTPEDITVKSYLKELGWPFTTMIGVYLLSVLVSGDRGPLMIFGLLVVGGYLFVSKKKIKILKTFLFVFISAKFIAFLAGVRSNAFTGHTFLERVELAWEEDWDKEQTSFIPITSELSVSGRILYHSLNYVPQYHDFIFGKFQFKAIAQVFPFFDVYYPIIFDDPSEKYLGSAKFMTWHLEGPYASYGVGTNSMADLYLDFGLLGVIGGMFLFGFLMRYSEVVMFSSSLPGLFVMILSFVYFTEAVYISRSIVLGPVRNIVWVYLLILINRKLSKQKTFAKA